METKLSDRYLPIIKFVFWSVVFLFLFLFFSTIHPVQVFDGDDWTYIAYARDAVPSTHVWNPTRVFPEIFMPTVGFIAAFFVTPILGNYLDSMTLSFAFVIALFITLYLFTFYKLLRSNLEVHDKQALLITLLFLIMHFWIFRSQSEKNIHLFLSRNLTCYFFYTIPVLLNAILVMYCEQKRNHFFNCGTLTRGFLLLLFYLAIYSNLFSSIVIVAYSGVVLLQEVILKMAFARRPKNIISYIQNNLLYIGIVTAWIISLFIEIKGGRANSLNVGFSFSGIQESVTYLWVSLEYLNKYFLVFLISIYIAAVVVMLFSILKSKDIDKITSEFLHRQFRYLGSFVIITIFQILLCTVTSLNDYIICADVLISILFFVLLATLNTLIYVLNKLPSLETLLPFILCIALFNCHSSGKTYISPSMYPGESTVVHSITDSIMSQIYDANATGLVELEILVPVFDDAKDNWPLSLWLGERISKTLYEHGQTDYLMQISIRPDFSLNKIYRMNVTAP